MFLILYVDDILLIGNNVGVISSVMSSVGEANFILGIKLWRDHKNKMLGLSQAEYIERF